MATLPILTRAAAERMLSQLGLDLNQSVRQMSKGMKEKVQLVLTMSRRAKLYLLDEDRRRRSRHARLYPAYHYFKL